MGAARAVGALRQLAACGAAAAGGVAIGVAYSEHPALRAVLSKLPSADVPVVDLDDPQALVSASVRVANEAGGLCVLSTRARDGGVSSRMIQPLPAEVDAAGSPSLIFHTTARSTKFAELTRDGRCTLTFLNPAALSCITFIGTAERLPPAEEKELDQTWPLFPPLSMLYPGDTRCNFSGWRLRPSRVQLVSIPAELGGGSRDDWKAPEVERSSDGAWVVTCRGGMRPTKGGVPESRL